MCTNNIMCDTVNLIQLYCDELLHSILFALADCLRDLGCFTQTCTNMAIAVADNN